MPWAANAQYPTITNSIVPSSKEGHITPPATAYFLTFFACLTRFSITSSNASRSPFALSLCMSQYSRSWLARCFISSSKFTCFRISSSPRPISAASVVEHTIRAPLVSRSGGGAGPRRFRSGFEVDVLREMGSEPLGFKLSFAPMLRISRDGSSIVSSSIDGSTNFFCLLAGNISSRSTGTPSETRKRRLIRERIQSGGCRGGGATSCSHSD